MEVFTLKEWEENFDALLERVENGEHIGIVREDGTGAVMMPTNDDFYRIYTEHNNEAQ
jgi:antitoxin (DNA-binding transcriptional repressor) of toxin-antitoxin stability system